MSDVRPIDRALARELARSFPGAERAAIELAERASAAVGAGHACLDLADEDAAAIEALAQWSAVEAGDGDAPLVLADRARLYLRRYWRYERDVARGLAALAAAPNDARHGAEALPELHEGQRAAVAHALAHRLTVILGGPGTGKTHTVLQVLVALARAGLAVPERMLLAAPTGKAAARLEQAVHAERRAELAGVPAATTLHRLLGARPRTARVRHDADDPLDADLLVIDETSMVDLPLLSKALAALPSGARLVLLGDPDQLASVEVGAVLGELAALGGAGIGARCVRLTHNFRAADRPALAALLDAVRAGDAEAAIGLLRAGGAGVRWLAGDDRRAAGLALAAAWRGATPAAIPPREALDAVARSRVLCALRDGPYGVGGLNPAIQHALGVAPVLAGEPPHGTPILVLHNDPLSGLSNGDVGVVLHAVDGAHAWFDASDRGVRALALGALPRFEPAHAMTVHKAQGSEFDRVLVVVPEPAHDSRFRRNDVVTREWLYTALSRAREEAVLVASEEAVRAALANRSRRASGLAQALFTHNARASSE